MIVTITAGLVLIFTSYSTFLFTRDRLHPAVLFPAVWGGAVTIIGLAEPYGYLQITPGTFILFITGILSFMMGALIEGRKKKFIKNTTEYNLDFIKICWLCLILHAIMLPVSWIEISQITAGADDVFASAYRLRSASVSGEENVGPLTGNYLTSGLFFISVLLIGRIQKKIGIIVFVFLITPWIILNIYVGGRSGLVMLILASIYIYISQGGGISLGSLTLFSSSFVFILVAGNLLVGKIDAGIEDGIWTILQQSIKGFFDYFLQGPILFSQYFGNPNSVNPTWDAMIFPCHILEKLNLCEVPSQHQDFMAFSYNGEQGNVYSMFFSIYPKYGWIGLILITGLYGFVANFYHTRRGQSIFNQLIAGFIFSAIFLSIFADSLGPRIYFFLKIFLLSLILSYAFTKPKNSSSYPGR